MNIIRISAVSYINTKPFLYGIQKSSITNLIQLSLDTPAECARKLFEGETDIGLVPVVMIPEIKGAVTVTDYCIGSHGAVGSVLLVSELPLDKIETIYLDYQSRTSVELIKILTREYWKIDVVFLSSEPGYETLIKGTTAGLIIGDRALQLKNKFIHVYDLGLAWHEFTNLPFVFACWVSNKNIPDDFLNHFNLALKKGVSSIDALLAENAELSENFSNINEYLKKQIHYRFDQKMKAGLGLFLQLMKQGK